MARQGEDGVKCDNSESYHLPHNLGGGLNKTSEKKHLYIQCILF